MNLIKVSIITCSMLFGVLATDITANAAIIDHDKVIGFQEVKPTTLTQKIEKQYQPFLNISSGAVPFPAVNAAGDTSGGLKPSGDPHGHASHSIGQVYARSAWHNGMWAIMYSWYFPKDEPDTTHLGGHRHDWENIVVWLDNPANQQPKVLKISYSAHGGYTSYGYSDKTFQGSHPLVDYGNVSSLGFLDHSLAPGYGKVGGQQPLIDWYDLSPQARTALTNTDFGKANVPFKDWAFETNLNKSWNA